MDQCGHAQTSRQSIIIILAQGYGLRLACSAVLETPGVPGSAQWQKTRRLKIAAQLRVLQRWILELERERKENAGAGFSNPHTLPRNLTTVCY